MGGDKEEEVEVIGQQSKHFETGKYGFQIQTNTNTISEKYIVICVNLQRKQMLMHGGR